MNQLECWLKAFSLYWHCELKNMNVGGEEHWLGLWRRKHWLDGSNLTSCLWWWTPRVRVNHLSFLLSLSVSFFLYLCWWIFCSCRVIPKTLMPREVLNFHFSFLFFLFRFNFEIWVTRLVILPFFFVCTMELTIVCWWI